ncbi:hypothetical protein LCGC14_0380540 [marine sediment metagenome]|uniref:DNA (cytosine-5-)-methyltransferase n=1 Tax=marine sediment metagenome TaxID=412755 RepID=A0A0F9WBA9_9ZZZZ
MKWFSLFSGIGGFDLALQNTGQEIVGACEIDKYARETYKKNFGRYPSETDATKIIPEQLPNIDGLCAGFPCQAFSIAGKRLGFEESRGTLFFEIARITKQKRPKILLLENVKGLLSHDKGRTFETILKTLDELGYDAEWQVLNSKYFVPQNRERIFIIGHLRGASTPKIFPIKESIERNVETRSKTQKSRKLVSSQTIPTIDSGYQKGYGNRAMIYMSFKSANMKQRIQKRDTTWILTAANNDFGIIEKGSIRRLTPLECERLQGFPDGWTSGVSDAQRYKQLGNAVTVPVVEFILSKLLELH